MARIIDGGLRLPEGMSEGDLVIGIPSPLPSQNDGQDKEPKRPSRKKRGTSGRKKQPKGRKTR